MSSKKYIAWGVLAGIAFFGIIFFLRKAPTEVVEATIQIPTKDARAVPNLESVPIYHLE